MFPRKVSKSRFFLPRNQMGIENLYTWIVRLRAAALAKDFGNEPVLSLLIDGNGILHEVAQKTYAYGAGETPEQLQYVRQSTDAQLEALYIFNLYAQLDSILQRANPTQSFVLAIDGVAPPAKLRQQRQRRYNQANGKLALPPGTRFNSAAITPGTEFMQRIDLALQSWIVSRREVLPAVVVYSSHMVHGEGEHKIFRLIRDGVIPDGKGIHAVYGLDADLVMLSMLSPYRDRIVLIRENFTNLVKIGTLAALVHKSLNGLDRPQPANLQIPIEMAIQDFVVMVYLIGNDFLPKFFAFNDVGLTIEMLFQLYRAVVMETRETLTTREGGVVMRVLAKFLQQLAAKEVELLTTKASLEFPFPSKILLASAVRTELPGVHDDDLAVRNRDQPRYLVKSFDFHAFRYRWYWQLFTPKTSEGTEIFADLPTEKHPEDRPKGEIFDGSDISLMCKWYLYGIQWVLSYYRGQIHPTLYTEKPDLTVALPPVALSYMYPYRSAPLLSDIAVIAERLAAANVPPLTLPIAPMYLSALHQLVAVLPPMSFDLIPRDQVGLVMPGGVLSDLCPVGFQVENEARYNQYHVVPILPELDLPRIMAAVNGSLRTRTRYGKVTAIIPGPFRESVDLISRRVPLEISELAVERQRYPQVVGRGTGRGRSGVANSERGRGTGRGREGVTRGAGRGRGEGRGRNVADGERGRGREGAVRGRITSTTTDLI
jgi:hypothetical protein